MPPYQNIYATDQKKLTQSPVPNPHSPAPGSLRQQPVNIPGVFDQTRRLYQPYQAEKESK